MESRKKELHNKFNREDRDDDEFLKSGKLFPGDLEIKSFDDIPEELKEEPEIVMALKELCRVAHDPMVIKLLKMREEKNMVEKIKFKL